MQSILKKKAPLPPSDHEPHVTMKPSRHPSVLTVKPNGLTISAPVDINEAQCHRASNYGLSPPSSLGARKREIMKVYVCLVVKNICKILGQLKIVSVCPRFYNKTNTQKG